MAGTVTRNVTAPDPSRWTTSARSAVPTTTRLGRAPTSAQDAADDRVEEAGVGHDPEVEDREDEHPRERGHVPDAAHDEPAGLQPEPAGERRDGRHHDERDAAATPACS